MTEELGLPVGRIEELLAVIRCRIQIADHFSLSSKLHSSYRHLLAWPLFTQLGEVTDADNGMKQLYLETYPVDTRIRIIRFRIPDQFWLK